jgi:Protein of unknown function (DUF1552)
MFISKMHLDRRTFLRGMGATIALPFLDAMVPARTALAATAQAVPRLAFVYFPHGAVMREWTPETAGPLVRLGRILEPFSAFSDRLTIVSGLENRHAYGPVHAITPGTWLSGMSPREAGASFSTADQIAARHIGRGTQLPSIQLGTESPRTIPAGAWEGVYSSGLASTISFRDSAPLPMAFDPRDVFDTLFAHDRAAGGRTTGGSAPASVLDLVAADTVRLRRRLGTADRAILHDYLDTVRNVERRADSARAMSSTERTHLMFDMIALAFQADITRVASFMMAAETSQTTYDEIGVADPFHALSHHQNDPEKIEKLVRIQSHHARLCASFVRKLGELADGDGSLLDRSLILYGSNMSNSHAHDHCPLPSVLIGGACGRLRGGRHVRYPDPGPLSNLLLTMLAYAGVPVSVIGDSTGGCSEV